MLSHGLTLICLTECCKNRTKQRRPSVRAQSSTDFTGVTCPSWDGGEIFSLSEELCPSMVGIQLLVHEAVLSQNPSFLRADQVLHSP